MSSSKSKVSGGLKSQVSKNITTSKSSGGQSGVIKKVTGATSGFTKTTHIQVIFNGKIVTPQSLLLKKNGVAQNGKKTKTFASAKPREDTIPELPDKSNQPKSLTQKKLVATSSMAPDTMSSFTRKATQATNDSSKFEEKVIVCLSETNTETLLSLRSLIISNETREVVAMEEKNAKYDAVIESHKNSDGFSSRQTQTLNNSQKNQNEMAVPNASQDTGCQSSSYEIADALAGTQTTTDADTFTATSTQESDDQKYAGLAPHVRKFVRDTLGTSTATPGCLLDVNDLTRHSEPQEAPKKDAGRTGSHYTNSGTRQQRSTLGAISTSQSNVGSGNITGGHSAAISGGEGSGSRPSNSGVGVSGAQGALSGGGSEMDLAQSDVEGSGSGLVSTSSGAAVPDSVALLREREAEAVLNSKALMRKLQLAERAVLQNIYHRQHLDYRDFPDVQPLVLASSERAEVIDSTDKLFGGLGLGGISMAAAMGASIGGANRPEDEAEDSEDEAEEKEEKTDPTLPRLFQYRAENIVRGRPVTAMSWNAANTDLLAVGYGRIDFSLDGGQKQTRGAPLDEELNAGLVLFWSLRNPEHPEKFMRTPHPVTSLDFSKRSPALLAVGLYNGDVSVYDVQREADWGKPVQTSIGVEGGHVDPVWQVRWIVKGQDRVESLVTISTDGRVLEWSLKKGMVMSTLMALKRGGAGEGWISRQASGLALDFVPGDSATYVVGTEEGQVHRCSVSYSEQYLDTYEPHNGPVYRLKFSPRWSDVFLSCSADWTMALHHIRSSSGGPPLVTFHCTGQEYAVTDISWCPGNSTVFAAVTADAKLQIWDLSVSAIDPVVNVDTDAGTEEENLPEPPPKTANTNASSMPPTPLVATRKPPVATRRDDSEEKDSKESAVSKLLRSLSQAGGRRSLTTVLFGERSPIVVVGDSRGAVSVYRVSNPVLFTHEGPLQQLQKLRVAVLRQSDAADSTKFNNEVSGGDSFVNSGHGNETNH